MEAVTVPGVYYFGFLLTLICYSFRQGLFMICNPGPHKKVLVVIFWRLVGYAWIFMGSSLLINVIFGLSKAIKVIVA